MADDEQRDDKTEPITPGEEPADETSVIPPAWSGRAGVPPPPGGLRDSAPYAPYTTVEPAPIPPRTWWTPVLLGMLALGLLGVVVLAAWLMSRDPVPVPVESPTPEPPISTVVEPTLPTTPAEQTPTATAQPQLVEVPVLVGRSQNDAMAELDRVGLSYRFEYAPSAAEEGTVIATGPEAGQQVPARTTVTLVISLGSSETATPSATPQ